MGTSVPLLVVTRGTKGSFVHWLEKLGLKQFITEYPLQLLVQWGWLKPQYRVSFPDAVIRKLEDSLGPEVQLNDEEQPYAKLWGSEWWIDDSDEPFWFIHPFLRPGNEAGRLLRNGDSIAVNGHATHEHVEYFYHWQAYALIDTVRSLAKYPSLLDTPDIADRTARLVSLVIRSSASDYSSPSKLPTLWDGLAEPMTWLSYYRALKAALSTYSIRKPDGDKGIFRLGAFDLADYFSLSPDVLEAEIKSKLLVLAQNWRRWGMENHDQLVEGAWPELEIDIRNGVEWLCHLTGKTIDDFLDAWKYEGYYGQREWAQLVDVLPYASYRNKQTFLRNAPIYLKNYNSRVPEAKRLIDRRLEERVNGLLRQSRAFGSFVYAFAQMHEALTHTVESFNRIDFSERRPLDFYLMLAIVPEVAFREALRSRKKLRTNGKRDGLKAYIDQLASDAGYRKACQTFPAHWDLLTKLDGEPEGRLGEIANLLTGLPPAEDYLAKAFLFCGFARNYFAHHDYLGPRLLRDEHAGLLFSGVLVTLLVLLPE